MERELNLRAYARETAAPTFPAVEPRISIDWVLLSDGLEFSSHRVVGDIVSDHRAVVADIALRTATPL